MPSLADLGPRNGSAISQPFVIQKGLPMSAPFEKPQGPADDDSEARVADALTIDDALEGSVIVPATQSDMDAEVDEENRRRTRRPRKRAWALEGKLGQIVGKRSLELLAQGVKVVAARREVKERLTRDPDQKTRLGRHPITREQMALIQVAMYMESDCIRSSWSGFDRLCQLGFIDKAPHPNTVAAWRRFEGLKDDTQIGGAILLGTLHELFLLTLEPARNLYDAYIIDSTGYTINGSANWRDCKKGVQPKRKGTDWLRFHLLSCRDTKMALAFKATERQGKGSADSINAIPLMKEAWNRHIRPCAVYGDNAYDGDEILAHIIRMGADPLIRLSDDFDPDTKVYTLKEHAQHLFDRFFSPTNEFWDAFGQRNIIESTMFAFKDETGDCVWAKNPGQRLIEIYCKVIIHNLRRLVRLELEYKMLVDFGGCRAFPHLFQIGLGA
jgi:transposase